MELRSFTELREWELGLARLHSVRACRVKLHRSRQKRDNQPVSGTISRVSQGREIVKLQPVRVVGPQRSPPFVGDAGLVVSGVKAHVDLS